MKFSNSIIRPAFMTAIAQALIIAGPARAAQQPDSEQTGAGLVEADKQQIIVTGTRRTDRTVSSSAIPIDVFTSENLIRQGTSDTNALFQNIIPSFSVPQAAISDGSSFVRPPNMRGLPPDQTLVLLNGKRRHRSALVNVDVSAMSVLSQAVDLAQIPAIAIDRVEVLRDGASALYGSDAIAGVINISLRKADSGLVAQARYGQHYEGDGKDYQFALNKGFALGDNGFVNISAEYFDSGSTSRGTQRPGALQLQQERPGLTIANPVQEWGKTAVEGGRLFVNGAFDFGDSSVYFFGNYGHSKGRENFNYRQPFSTTNFGRTGLFGVTYYLDVLANGNRNANGRTYDFTQLYPNGFTPLFFGTIDDLAGTVGYRGVMDIGLTYDLSASYGQNQLRYSMTNSLNPSFGPQTPTSFNIGTLKQSETNFNADLSYPVELGLASPLNIAFGGEFRRSAYEVGLGDREAWAAGPFARQVVQRADGSTFVVTSGVGSNGFGGFGPSNAGLADQKSYAAYLDLEADVTKAFSLGFAARYEHFSDFGDTFNVKGSARLELSDAIALRGAASTGFRAPTPGQTSVNNVSTSFIAGNPNPVEVGTFAVSNPASIYYGAVPVKPERSMNFTGGVVITPADRLSLTFDYYNIEVRDRIGLSQAFTVTAADRIALQALGVENAEFLNRVQFLTNAFKTRTQGFDAVMSYVVPTDSAGTFNSALSVNYNKTDVVSRNAAIISNDRVANLEKILPRFRVNFTETWDIGNFSLLVRANYYDSFTVTAASGVAQTFGSEIIADIEASYQLTENIQLAVGAQNLFDNYPDRDRRTLDPVFGLPANGNQYIDASPFGYSGGFWYLRAGVTF